MQPPIISSNSSLVTPISTVPPPPDNFISQKLSFKFFDFMPKYLSQQDLKAVHCVDKYWNEISIIWLKSQEICCSFSKPNEVVEDTSIENKWLFAAKSGDLDTIKTLIKTNPTLINIKNNDGDNACHIAVANGHAHLVDFFQDHSNLLYDINNDGFSPFHLAVANDQREIVENVIKKDHAIVRSTNLDGANGLQISALKGLHEIFELLYPCAKELIHRKFANELNNNMLQLAIDGTNIRTIQWIVNNFPSQISEPNAMGTYPVHTAIQVGHFDAVKLLDEKCSSLIKMEATSNNALHFACSPYSNFEIFMHIYQRFPHMRMAENIENKQPVHIAISSNRLDVVEFYVQKHPQFLKSKLMNGYNPLHLTETLEMTRYLYNTAPSLLFDFHGTICSPFHTAGIHGRLDVVKFYLECGQDVYKLKDASDCNILHYAAFGLAPRLQKPGYKENQIEVVRFLINQYPQLLQDRDKNNKYPYMYALKYISKEIASEMVSANVNYRQNLNSNKPASQEAVPSTVTNEPAKIVEKKEPVERNKHDVAAWFSAVDNGDPGALKHLVHDDPTVINIISDTGDNAAHRAISNGHLHIVEFFCDYPHLFTQTNHYRFTPFLLAMNNGNAKITEFLCSKGGDFIHIPAGEKLNRLQLAAIWGQAEIFEILYKFYPELIHAIDEDTENSNILHLAIEGKNYAVVKSICAKCPSLISKCDDKKVYPIHDAIENRQLQIVKLLDRKCPSILKLPTKSGTALHQACMLKDNDDVFKYIYERHKDMRTAYNDEKSQPFHVAVAYNNLKIVKFYISKNKKVLYAKAIKEYNVLHISKNLEIVKYLYSLDKNLLLEKDNSGYTPLHYAVENLHQDIVEFYLNCNESIYKSKTLNKKNILHLAAHNKVASESKEKQEKLIRFLTDKYPQLLQEEDSSGFLPYKYALNNLPHNLALYMMGVNKMYQENEAKKLASAPLETDPLAIATPPTIDATKEKKASLPRDVENNNAISNKKNQGISAPQPVQSLPTPETELKDTPKAEKTPLNAIVAEEKKEKNLPQEVLKAQNAPSTIPEKEPYFTKKPATPENEPASLPRTKKASVMGRMRSKVEDAWNNTVGLSSAEKAKRREERKQLHRESMSVSVSQSDWSRTVRSDWSQSVRTERSEIEKSLAEGEFESLVEALQTDNLDKKVMSETLQQLEKLNVIEIPNTNNDKVRANYTGECHGDKRPSLTIHKHNHDKDWDQQHRVQANFINFINECGLNTEEIKNQPMARKNNTNDEPQDAGEG